MKTAMLSTACLLSASLAMPGLAEESHPAPAEETQVQLLADTAEETADAPQVTADATADAEEVIEVTEAADADDIEIGSDTIRLMIEEADGKPNANGGRMTTHVFMLNKNGKIVQVEGDGAVQIMPDGSIEFDGNGVQLELHLNELPMPPIQIAPDAGGGLVARVPQIGQRDGAADGPANPPIIEATYLGINCDAVDFDTASLLMIDQGTGLTLSFVAEDSPAQAAGLQAGDTLVRFNDQILINPGQLAVLIRTQEAGDTVTLDLIREGESLRLEVELGQAMVPQLGPGGQNLEQLWKVERQLNPAAEEGALLMEGRIELDAEAIQPILDQVEAQLQVQVQQGGAFLLADGAGKMASSYQSNNGNHEINVTDNGQGKLTLHIAETDGGAVLFDNNMPNRDKLNSLPEEVVQEVLQMMDMFDLELPE